MFFHCRMIHSILEQIIPSWNKSFQDGMIHSRVVPEFGYDTFSQNSGSIFVNWIWKNFFFISICCRDMLHLPLSGSLLWNDSFQSGKNHSRLEWILPGWKFIYWCGVEKPIQVLNRELLNIVQRRQDKVAGFVYDFIGFLRPLKMTYR